MTDTIAENKLILDGVSVGLYNADPEYPDGTPDDIVIYIDTTVPLKGNLRIRINDALVYHANPEKNEAVEHTALDGYFIVNA